MKLFQTRIQDGQAPENVLIKESGDINELQEAGNDFAGNLGIETGTWTEAPQNSGKFSMTILEGMIYLTIEP